jgi:hypothetical protein
MLAALVCDLVCPTCSSFSCWVALTALHAQVLIFFNPYAFLSFFFPLPHSFPYMSANAHKVSPQPNCETVAIFLWPANRPVVGCLLRQQLSLFRFCLLARAVWCQLLILHSKYRAYQIPASPKHVRAHRITLPTLLFDCCICCDKLVIISILIILCSTKHIMVRHLQIIVSNFFFKCADCFKVNICLWYFWQELVPGHQSFFQKWASTRSVPPSLFHPQHR